MCTTPEAVATCTHSIPMASPADCPCPGPWSACGGCFYCGMRWALVKERRGNLMVGASVRVSAHQDHGSWLTRDDAEEAALVQLRADTMVELHGRQDAAVIARDFGRGEGPEARFYRLVADAIQVADYIRRRDELLGMIRAARRLQVDARRKDDGEAKRHLAEVIHGSQLHLAHLRAQRRIGGRS